MATAAAAQERVDRSRHAASRASDRVAVASPAPARSLTVNRRPLRPYPGFGAEDDIYVDGQTRYNSIRTFDPAPYADSGRQYPFGLDGIGGYGSDLGLSAGHDGLVYDRGF